uniref:DUF4005 domain-containing protein n=1 Tax=Nelumbo nucifera TaxID=4432 RepID=A0A822XIP0_NELNU|nr:TPA_asm: hypothetical protein HUJ06_021723 [Nelumbo nucifera]
MISMILSSFTGKLILAFMSYVTLPAQASFLPRKSLIHCSFKAKVRSYSAPKQRPEPGPRKKLSPHTLLAGVTGALDPPEFTNRGVLCAVENLHSSLVKLQSKS